MDEEDLLDSDRQILKVLEHGRCTPSALADWTELSTQTVHNRLNVLVAAEWVEKVHRSGLYEITEGGRARGNQ